MRDWTRSMVATAAMVGASMLCLLPASPARAQQGPAAEDLDALKRKVDEVISQNEELRRRVRELEEAVSKHGPAAADPAAAGQPPKDPATQAATTPPSEPFKTAKGSQIQLGGAIEMEAGSRRSFRSVRSSDLALGTAEFDFEADVIDWGKAELSLEWDSAGDKITVGEALITLAKPSKLPVYLKTGRGVVPFGISTGTTVAARFEESLTITGPLTIEVFETKEDYAQLGVNAYGFNAGFYIYNGSTDNNVRGKQLEHYGFTVSYAQKTDLVSFDVGVDWIDSVFDSNGLTGAFPELVTRPRRAYTPGIAGRARFGLWGFSLVGEYNGATRQANFTRDLNENLVPVRTRPEAWQVELGYTGRIFDVRPYGAFSYSETSGLRAGFPKKRILGAVGTWLSDNMRVVLEYANEVDYSKVAEGTGRDSDAMTLRLTYEW